MKRTGVPPRPLADRFWEKVNKDGPVVRTELGPCWLWTASAGITTGYGRINLGRTEGVETAHRVSWLLSVGPIPDGKHVLHRCDVRRCVRPSHLFLGTNDDNVADMNAKGRHVSAMQRLTFSDVVDVRSLVAFGADRGVVAAEFGITREYLGKIVCGRRAAA
jgi:hypothetical protein